MTLQGDWDETETANAITSIFGYNENSSEGGDERSSAIPWILDDWFHADNRQNPWPSDRENTLGTKSLKEYDDNFPNFRIKTAVEIGFDHGEDIGARGITSVGDGDRRSATPCCHRATISSARFRRFVESRWD
jgi:hypothetical protein